MKRLTEKDHDKIEVLYKQDNMTLADIGALFGVTGTTITRALTKRGIDVNPAVLPKQLDSLTLAYYAGLFDGEGHITIGASKRPQFNDRVDYWLQIGIVSTYLSILDDLKRDFGVGHLSKLYGPDNHPNRLPASVWRCTSNQAKCVLEILLPYLRIKADPARLAIEFQKNMKNKPNKEWQLSIKQEITALNRLS